VGIQRRAATEIAEGTATQIAQVFRSGSGRALTTALCRKLRTQVMEGISAAHPSTHQRPLRQATAGVGVLAALVPVVAILCATDVAAQAAPAPRQWTVVTLPAPVATGGVPASFAEPGIVIGADGTALVDAASANTGAPPAFWLSHDAAATWGPGHDVDASGASTGDADAAIGSDGWMYALNLGYTTSPPPAQPSNPTVQVYSSRDGAQWSGPATFPPPHGVDQPDRPWLAVDPRHPADVDVVNSEVGGNIVMWRSTDHGATFAGPTPVTGGANGQAALALSSRPLFDPSADGRLFMLYETTSTAAGVLDPSGYEFPMTQVWLAESTDSGSSWTNTLVLDASALPDPAMDGTVAHLLVASAIDPSGNLFTAFALRPSAGTATHVEVIHSTDHGQSWSSPVQVAAATASNVMPALAAGAGGSIDISWYGSPAADFRDTSARWSEMFAESSNALSAQPSFTVSQVTGVQPVHVGALDTAGAVGSDAGANWGLRDFQSLALDACGQPHPVWADDVGHVTQTAASGAVACTAGTVVVSEQPTPALLVLGGVVGAVVVGLRRRARRRGARAPARP
jgi:hypothetical protein